MRPSTVTTYASRSEFRRATTRIVARTESASPALTAWRAWTASAVAWSSRRPPVVCACSPRSSRNSVAPIASHVTTATPTNARAIRAVSPRGIGGQPAGSVGASALAGASGPDLGIGSRDDGRRGSDRLARRRDEPVADAADRLDRRPVGAELLAHLGDVDVDRPGLAREVGAPDVLEQAVAGEDDARIAGEGGEEVELARAQVELALADGGLPPTRVDPQRAHLHGPAAARHDVGPPQDRLDPGDERPRVERLGHVVVGAELEADDRVDVVVAGGEHEDRRVAAPPELAADLEAVDLGEHQVEDDEVGLVAGVQRESLLAVRGADDRVALLLQVQAKEVDDVALVVDDEDRLHRRKDTDHHPWPGRPM